MAAPKGNQFWKLRSKHGRDTLFATPSLLWEAACEYFESCDQNPWKVNKTKIRETDKPITETEETTIQLPYSMKGLCVFLGCNSKYFYDFRVKCSEDFADIITCIEDIIETQQMNGATVGVYNANIVARKLGLADKQEHTGANGSNLFGDKPLTKAELAERMKELDNEI